MYVLSKLGNLILLIWKDRVSKSNEITIDLDDTLKGDFTIEFPKTPKKILVEVKQTQMGLIVL